MENVYPCLYTAEKYHLPGLVEKCSEFLGNSLDVNNVCQVNEEAIMYKLKPLQERCLSFIIDNAEDVFASPGFLEISFASLMNVIKREELLCNEVDVFKAAVRWATHNRDNKSNPTVEHNLRDQLGEALFQIRFPIMPIEDFAKIVHPANILTKEELLNLYPYIATEGSLPSSHVDNFIKDKRSGVQVTINLKQYLQRQDKSDGIFGCCLEIEGGTDSVLQRQVISHIVT
jgi:hypothetical protein